MRPRFSLGSMFGCLTTVCVIAALVHGGLYYREPYGTICRIGLGVLGIVLFFASWRGGVPKRPEA